MLYASLQSSYKDRCKHPALSNMAFACFGRSPNATKNSPVMNPAHLLRRAFPGKGIWADPIFVQLVVVILSMESPSKHRCSWDWYWLYFLNGKLSKFSGALPLHHYPVSQIDVFFRRFFKALDSPSCYHRELLPASRRSCSKGDGFVAFQVILIRWEATLEPRRRRAKARDDREQEIATSCGALPLYKTMLNYAI